MSDTPSQVEDELLEPDPFDSKLDTLDEAELELLLLAADDHADPEYPEEFDLEDNISNLPAAKEEVELAEEDFQDDLEAVEELKKEQKEKWDREGVVIRGNRVGKTDLGLVIGQNNHRRKVRRERNQREYLRQKGKGVCRSSSLPPDSPTPAGFCMFERRSSILNSSIGFPPTSSPTRECGSQSRKFVGVIELVEEEEEEQCEAQTPIATTPKSQKANIERTRLESLHSETSIDMDMDIDVPDSTMLEYPSSPPPPAPCTPPSKQMQKRRAQPFAYGESQSDDDAVITGNEKEKAQMDTLFRESKWIEVPTTTANVATTKKKAGPFEEVDEDDEDDDELEELRTVRVDKGKGRATDLDDFDPTLDFYRNTNSEFYSQLNKPPFSTKPASSSSKPLPFSYNDPDEPVTNLSAFGGVSEFTDSLPTYGYSRPGPNTVPVLLISGKKLHIKRKPPKRHTYSTRTYTSEVTYDADGNREVKDSYYGVEIHKLLDQIQAEKKLAGYAKEKEAEQAAASESMCIDSVLASPAFLIAGRQQRTLLWTEKYRAKRFTDLLGDERTHRQVLRWLKHWDDIVFPGSTNKRKNKDENEGYLHKKVLLITGPPGLGKTTLAHVTARQAGYEPLEINASDDRTANVVKGKIRDALSNEGVRIPGVGKKKGIGSSRPVCVVVDEIDGVSGGGGETGFMSALVDLILQDQKNSATPGVGPMSTTNRKRKGRKGDNFKFHRPIIAICNDLYAPSLRALRPLAEIVYMKKPPTGLMIQRLKWVFEKEGVPCEDAAVRRLVELSTSGSAAQAASGGGGGGDMRGCLVSGEWLAKRLSTKTSISTTSRLGLGVCTKLTRKLVEEELEGRTDSTGSSRGGVRGCVERVFRKGDTTNSKGAAHGAAKLSTTEFRRREWESLKEEVECCGEFDKIMTDIFGTYLTRPYHDDTRLSKPNLAYEWLWFYDLMSSRIFVEQDFELMGYLAVPSMAFNTLFGTSAPTAAYGAFLTSATKMGGAAVGEEEDTEAQPFQGPKADWDHREGVKATKNIVQSIQSNLLIPSGSLIGQNNNTSRVAEDQTHASPAAIRLASEFHSVTALVTELAPYLARILSPRVTPILIHGGGGSASSAGGWGSVAVASVRKESEKKLVKRAVEVMYSTNIFFEKVRVEFSSHTPSTSALPAAGGWAYRMDPAIDQLASFPTFILTGGEAAIPVPTRYAVRQVLSQELHKYSVLQRQAARDARVAKLGLDAATLTPKMGNMKVDYHQHNTVAKSNTPLGKSLKRDFFGRVVEEKSPLKGEGDECGSEAKRRKKEDGEGKERKVWVSFHEGFSDAVKKRITLEDLLGGLY